MDKDKEPENNDNADKKKSSHIAIVREIFIYAIVIIVCVFVVPQYVVQRTIVKGSSMETTLIGKDNLIVEKLSYHFCDPERYDIVVFYPFGRDNREYYVKRVIGLPGETVQIIGSRFYINNKELADEHFGKEDYIADFGIASEPVQLGEDEYFLVGDNRNSSFDSRDEKIGPVSKEKIDGRVLLRVYPFDKFGAVE